MQVISESLPGLNPTSLAATLDAKTLADMAGEAVAAANNFAARYKGDIQSLSPAEIRELLLAREDIERLQDCFLLPAILRNAADIEEAAGQKLLQIANDAAANIAEMIAFFDAEIAALGEERLRALVAATPLAPWRQFFVDAADRAHHALSADEEAVLSALDPESAWHSAYDREIAALRYDFRGQTISEAEIQPLFEDKDPGVRRDARAARVKAFDSIASRILPIMNELIRLHGVDYRLRNYAEPMSASLIDAGFDARDLAALEREIEMNGDIGPRFFSAKTQLLGFPRPATIADISGPFPGIANLRYGYAEAVEMVIEAWTKFSAPLGRRVAQLFDRGIVDAEPRTGKQPGAFCLSGATVHSPFVHMNWHGQPEDVLTLGHEIGHALHADIISEAQPPLVSQSGPVISEVVSTFAEGLVFDVMLEKATSEERAGLLGFMLEQRIATTQLQIANHKFEQAMHRMRAEGPIERAQAEEIYLAELSAYYGPAVTLDGGSTWARIWHFFQLPFYVWSYAASDLLSGCLLQMRKNPGFAGTFEQFLQLGGAASAREQLMLFGTNLSDQKFWRLGTSRLNDMLVLLEADARQARAAIR